MSPLDWALTVFLWGLAAVIAWMLLAATFVVIYAAVSAGAERRERAALEARLVEMRRVP